MDESETVREARLVRAADRDRFVIARGLVRTLLSRHVPVAPESWRFVAGGYGRPEIAKLPEGASPLRFNVSHTPGIVACAVTISRAVGLDVEPVHRRLTHNVAGRYFAAQEVRDLRALPIRRFAFTLASGAAPTIAFDETLADDPASWQFAQSWATPAHRLALAVRREGPDLPVAWETVVPGADA